MDLLKNKKFLILTLIYACFFFWWASFQHVIHKQGLSIQWYGGTYGLIAIIGTVFGFWASKKWGGYKTVLGKSLLFFTLGLLFQEIGQLIYQYYVTYKHVQIPYPSIGDIFYFGSSLLYITGAAFMAKAAGFGVAIKQTKYKVITVIVPIIIIGASFYLLLHGHKYDTSKPLTVFLDAGYPIVEAIYISIAVVAFLLSRKLLGGIIRSGIMFIIFALVIQYLGDFMFIFQSNRGTWIQGGKDDLIYMTSYFLMTVVMIKFLSIHKKIENRALSSRSTK